MNDNTVSVGLVQISGDPFEAEANRELANRSATTAFEGGADIVILPEMIIHGYSTDRRTPRRRPCRERVMGQYLAL